MRILERYIVVSVITVLLTCIFVFLFIYFIIDILSQLEDLLKNNVSIKLLLQYYLSIMPVMLLRVMPFACLLSTLYVFSKLNHNNEIIAMRTAGLSIPQISRNVFLLTVIASLFIFWINDRVAPSALVINEKIKIQMNEGKKQSKTKKEEIINYLTMYGLKNRLFFINKFNLAAKTMEGITILEHDEKQNLTKKIVANRGSYKENLWKFYHVITYNFDRNGQVIGEPIYMEEEIMSIPETPKEFASQRQRSELMTIEQLEEHIWKLSRSGARSVIRNFEVDLYQRFTSPLTCIIITLVAIPFALRMRRRATGLSSIGLSLLVGFLYYILDAIGIAFGKGGILPPLLATLSSHIIMLVFGLYMLETMP
ncbi:MAG: LptF/LptG family permease [Candidatus Omnitrophica bacterium]|nr:LptF/LptG family permease [Candidatus Omnitrophota bacterium]